MEQKALRMGTVVLAVSLLLRIMSTGVLGKLLPARVSPGAVSLMLFLQTGRLVRPSNIVFTPNTPDMPPDPTLPTDSSTEQQTVLTFSADAAAQLVISSSFTYTADLPGLLTQPLTWDLTESEAPTVLIVHSHGSESFKPTGEYAEVSPYHTLDTDHNMISIGAYVAQLLEESGISVLHDTALHDEPSYNASYGNSRKSIQSYLQEYPSIRLVLDLHRDSIEDEDGNQLAQTVFSEGTVLAPLMLVVGTDYGGLEHPQWQENLALALKLQTQLQSICPGICRNINLRSQRFNQDLSPGTLLVEVGTSGNTRQEALGAAKILAEGIISLAHGSQ